MRKNLFKKFSDKPHMVQQALISKAVSKIIILFWTVPTKRKRKEKPKLEPP